MSVRKLAGPLNDIASDASALIGDYIGHDDLRLKLQQILDNVGTIRKTLRQAAEGPNTILGAAEVKESNDPAAGVARRCWLPTTSRIFATRSTIFSANITCM